MTRTRIRKFRDALQLKREEIVRDVRSRAGYLEIESGGDEMDHVRGLLERSSAVESVDRLSRLLVQVQAALNRIADGTYGTCLACEREVPVKRLEVVPWAPYCVPCQQRAEQNELEAPEDEWPSARRLAS